MSLPFFYINNYNEALKEFVLDEDTSKHIVQVLRMKTGEQLNLTDGKGNLLNCSILDDHKKHCLVRVATTSYQQPATRKVSIAISLLKNSNRFEWFLEKATEIGVSEIIPLICERTEKEKFRYDRMQGICISAMLQSQQVWLPVLHGPVKFETIITQSSQQQKFIAHCEDENDKQPLTGKLINQSTNKPINQLTSSVILIGPEGDFTPQEIKLAQQHQFIPVTLGETRLRTETAALAAATLLCLR